MANEIQGLDMLQLMESGYASFEGNYNRKAIEDVLKLHRFNVFVWLMQNGVMIPIELLQDSIHGTSTNKEDVSS